MTALYVVLKAATVTKLIVKLGHRNQVQGRHRQQCLKIRRYIHLRIVFFFGWSFYRFCIGQPGIYVGIISGTPGTRYLCYSLAVLLSV